jgi:hypothetical protein
MVDTDLLVIREVQNKVTAGILLPPRGASQGRLDVRRASFWGGALE